jgi:hypothetical protein
MGARLKYIASAKELMRHLSSADYRSLPIERAFIKWILLAKYGISDGSCIVDGPNDGGIDAVFQVDHTHYVLQSKYEKRPRLSCITRNEIGAFEEVSNKLSNRGAKADFDTWIQTVRPHLRPLYSSLRREAINSPSSVRFLFATTKRFTMDPGEKVEVEDIQHISALWDLHSRGFTPPVEYITLSFEHEWEIPIEGGFKTHVGLVDTMDFLRLMENDKNERLFAQNVRTDLRSGINKGIQRTYEQEPDRFWLYNNGLYIVCSRIDHIGGKKLRLKYPSIINGSQTLHSIKHASKQRRCCILVRILVMDCAGNPDLLSAVIRRTNTQNPMKLINLSAQDPFQLNIARYLDRYHIFYERREKEWANEKKIMLPDYHPLGVKDVAQWLSVLHRQIGFGTARTKVSDLFQPTHYKRIFSDFDTHYSSDSYKSLAWIVWSGIFARNAIWYLPGTMHTFGKIAQLLLIRATYDAIKSDSRLQDRILQKLDGHKLGFSHVPRNLRTWYKTAVRSFHMLQVGAQRKDPQLDFSNYFKRNDMTARAYSKACSRGSILRLTELLTRNLDHVE